MCLQLWQLQEQAWEQCPPQLLDRSIPSCYCLDAMVWEAARASGAVQALQVTKRQSASQRTLSQEREPAEGRPARERTDKGGCLSGRHLAAFSWGKDGTARRCKPSERGQFLPV